MILRMSVYLYIYIYMYVYMYTYICVYIYIERERDRREACRIESILGHHRSPREGGGGVVLLRNSVVAPPGCKRHLSVSELLLICISTCMFAFEIMWGRGRL